MIPHYFVKCLYSMISVQKQESSDRQAIRWKVLRLQRVPLVPGINISLAMILNSRPSNVSTLTKDLPPSLRTLRNISIIISIIGLHKERTVKRSRTVKIWQSLYRPGQALRVPGGWGSQIWRQSTHEGSKFVSPTYRQPLPPQEIFLVLISVRDCVDARAHSAVGRIMSMKNSNDTIGNRTGQSVPVHATKTYSVSGRTGLITRHFSARSWWVLGYNNLSFHHHGKSLPVHVEKKKARWAPASVWTNWRGDTPPVRAGYQPTIQRTFSP